MAQKTQHTHTNRQTDESHWNTELNWENKNLPFEQQSLEDAFKQRLEHGFEEKTNLHI